MSAEIHTENNTARRASVWHEGERAGTIIIAGTSPADWQWESAGTLASKTLENIPGEMPNMIRYLEPEGALANILQHKGIPSEYIYNGIRFLSNITIGPEDFSPEGITPDRHVYDLNDHCEDHVYTGAYHGPDSEITSDFARAVERNYDDPLLPKFSGAQLKLPMNLSVDENGAVLSSATNSAFTHIVKFSEERGIQAAEWMGLELSERCGLPTTEKALIPLAKRKDPALAVPRFDIPSEDDAGQVSYLISDMANIAGVFPHTNFPPIAGKYGTPVEDLAQSLLEVSSEPQEDARLFFKRIVFGYFARDMDMHLKNISVLKKVDMETGEITTRLAPTYDVVPTVIFPEKVSRIEATTGERVTDELFDYRLALPINGKYGRAYSDMEHEEHDITSEDFLPLAESLNIPEEEALHIYAEMADNCARSAIAILDNPPAIIADNPESLYILHRAATEIVEEVENKTMEFYDDFDYDRRFYHNQRDAFKKWYDENITPQKTTGEDDTNTPHISEPAANF